MRICLITDTWEQVNGVVTTLRQTAGHLEAMGHTVLVIHPGLFRTLPMLRYPEIRMAWDLWRLGPMIRGFDPDAVHIATEGPLGLAARWYCKVDRGNIPYNTSYHTKFPEYLRLHWGIPENLGYAAMRMFHKNSHRVLVTTPSMARELAQRGISRTVVWSRGVDHSVFNPLHRGSRQGDLPVLVCVSRASMEKNLEAFCELPIQATKILVGDGPHLHTLRSRYPNVTFTGYHHGERLAWYYANADVMVFPSRSDTFGVVMLESMACGTPVAAYPVTGPIDVIEQGKNGAMHEDLSMAVQQALACDRHLVQASSHAWSWEACTRVFLENLEPIPR